MKPNLSEVGRFRADLEATHARMERLESALEPISEKRAILEPIPNTDSLEQMRAARVVNRRRGAYRLTYQQQVNRAVRLLQRERWLHWLRVRFLGLEAAVAWLCARGQADQVRTADGLVFVLRLEGGVA